MIRAVKFTIVAGLFGVLLFQFSQRQFVQSRQLEPTIVGDTVPDVELVAWSDTASRSLRSLAMQRCQLFYFWDPDCPACVTGAPAWSGRSNAGAGDSLSTVWILLAERDSSADRFLRQHDIRATTFYLREDGYNQVRAYSTPSVWAVSRGVVSAIRRGYIETHPDSLTSDLCSVDE